MSAPAPTKDRITCHVLDTSRGRPARGLRVQLSTTTPPPHLANSTTSSAAASASASASAASPPPGVQKTFESLTDDDGRVVAWLPYSSAASAGEVPVYTLEDVLGEAGDAPSRWTLRFDTAAYFGGDDETFFPEAVVVFTVKPGQQYHVPLLLSPFGYTTYRGS